MRALQMPLFILVLASLAATAFAQEDLSRVNGGVAVAAGERKGDLSTVNGGIQVGADARAGGVSTVNGAVTLGERAQVRSVEIVNGNVRLGRGVRVEGGVQTVNGDVFADRGSRVGGDVSTVNGAIGLVGTVLAGNVASVNGDITVGIGSRVRGGIRVPVSSSWFQITPKRKLRIVVGPDAVVEGESRFEREVVLYVHSSARMGPVTGAEARPFDTPTPPRN